jgi:hypothetical protein
LIFFAAVALEKNRWIAWFASCVRAGFADQSSVRGEEETERTKITGAALCMAQHTQEAGGGSIRTRDGRD